MGVVSLAEVGTEPQGHATEGAWSAGKALVSFDGVWRYWGRGKRRWPVLRDINLHLPPGTVTSISGGNGAGKTTLLRIASGIVAPDCGTVMIENLIAEKSWREYHRRVGLLSAGDRGLYPRVSVRGHLDYWVRLAFVPRAERREAVAEALEKFGLNELANRRADRLSQGQRQRLRLALAVVHRPVVLLLDEPCNSLDTTGLQMLATAVDGVLAQAGTAIWCSPTGEEQSYQFDRKCVIEEGRLIDR